VGGRPRAPPAPLHSPQHLGLLRPKDLAGFLNGELDFYLKNEVLDVDDLEAWGPERSGGWFEVMRAVKRVGRDVIAFLAQIEDFQKKLFEKKKLVVSAEYCITLDRVPEELYPEVAASDAQREEWVRLFAIDEIENITQPGYSEPLTTDFLKANPFLVLDTKHFDENFKDRLLASIEDLDGQIDGVLVESENFQALSLLQERYREQIRCIYIDPPYNTGNDEFLYKDSYQHSSWLSMMEGRLNLVRSLLLEDGVIFVSNDDIEQANLKYLADRVYGAGNFVANIIWQKKYAKQSDSKWFSTSHDHITLHARNKAVWRPQRLERTEEQLKVYSNPDNDPRGPWQSVVYTSNKSRSERPNLYYAIMHPETGREIYPSETRTWAYSQSQYEKHAADNRLWWGRNYEMDKPRLKLFLSEVGNGIVPDTIWLRTEVGDTQDAKRTILKLFADTAFDTPKPTKLIRRMLQLVGDKEGSLALDFFAGSGTTGHAVIDLNREDGGDRKYILVEMGEYFETVLKPRILKVIYSKDWRDGKPVSREGTSHAFKYLKLESYEDALDNIAFTLKREGQEALELYGDDYLLRYMLDFETRDSETLLNVEKLSAPFRYKLCLREEGETREVPVDLPETFAYLLGLRVRTRRVHHDGERRYLVYRGSTPERGEVAAIWRDTEGWDEADFDRDRDFVRENSLAEGADEVFVNGDSFIPEARLLEGLFKRLMLAGPAVG
jgi:adenine-specific DNA-methyltransferase